MVTCLESGVAWGVTDAFGHAQGGASPVWVVRCSSSCGREGLDRDCLGAFTPVANSIASTAATKYIASNPESQQPGHFERFVDLITAGAV